jgi:hypothetical protein
MKCKTKRVMEKPKEVTGKNGRLSMQGTCPKCNTKMCVFIKSKK